MLYKYLVILIYGHAKTFSGFANNLTIDASAKAQSVSVQRDKASPDRSSTPDSSFADGKSRNGEHALESESAFTHGEDEYARSPNGSPAGRTAPESPSQEFSDVHYGKSFEADAETHGYVVNTILYLLSLSLSKLPLSSPYLHAIADLIYFW